MSRYNMNVLADAKEEYTRQLVSVLSPEIYVGIKSIYDAAQNHCNKINDKNVLKNFKYYFLVFLNGIKVKLMMNFQE